MGSSDSGYIMAFDEGTTSARTIIFDRAGHIIAMGQKEIRLVLPEPGWVEMDAQEIFLAQLLSAREALDKSGLSGKDIVAIGITNQRETTVVWDKETGVPVYRAICWQCRRTAGICEEIADSKEMIRHKTGLILDPYFSATKIRWILDHVEGARRKAEEGKLLFGTMETWLIWKMTGGKVHVTDYSNASRTMLFNIHTMDWDRQLLELLSIPASMLPKPVPNSGLMAETLPEFFETPVRICGAAGDQQAALFGQCCYTPGDSKNTYGTGCFLLMNTGETPVMSKNGLVSTVAWKIGDKTTYALEGSVFMGGASIQWLRDEMGLIDNAAQSESYARKVDDTAGCYVVPAFTGLGAPYWDPYARGVITGLTQGVNKYHIVRATLDAIAYQVNDILRAMSGDAMLSIGTLKVDGGASRNSYLMQTQADISNTRIERPECIETTALGAAYLAGLAAGYWNDMEDIRKNASVEAVYIPALSDSERALRIGGWNRAVSRAFGWVGK